MANFILRFSLVISTTLLAISLANANDYLELESKILYLEFQSKENLLGPEITPEQLEKLVIVRDFYFQLFDDVAFQNGIKLDKLQQNNLLLKISENLANLTKKVDNKHPDVNIASLFRSHVRRTLRYRSEVLIRLRALRNNSMHMLNDPSHKEGRQAFTAYLSNTIALIEKKDSCAHFF